MRADGTVATTEEGLRENCARLAEKHHSALLSLDSANKRADAAERLREELYNALHEATELRERMLVNLAGVTGVPATRADHYLGRWHKLLRQVEQLADTCELDDPEDEDLVPDAPTALAAVGIFAALRRMVEMAQEPADV